MIIEMMNRIADTVVDAVEFLADFAYMMFWALVFILLIVTCPVWIIPFMIVRRILEWRSGQEDKEQDKGEVLE